MRKPGVLMILVPRHPDRGDAIVTLMRERGMTTQQWSKDKSDPAASMTDVLVADTIGELLFWYAVSDAVYLGGATAEGIGGHNPVEPAQLGKRVFTGPHGFNFRETFEAAAATPARWSSAETYQELTDYWLADTRRRAAHARCWASCLPPRARRSSRTLDAIDAMLPLRSAGRPMREPHFWTVQDKRSRASAPMTQTAADATVDDLSLGRQRRIAKADAGGRRPARHLHRQPHARRRRQDARHRRRPQALRLQGPARGQPLTRLSRVARGRPRASTLLAMHYLRKRGDEPLMLAATGEAWISKDRPAGRQSHEGRWR